MLTMCNRKKESECKRCQNLVALVEKHHSIFLECIKRVKNLFVLTVLMRRVEIQHDTIIVMTDGIPEFKLKLI